jgi:hypothetical protein
MHEIVLSSTTRLSIHSVERRIVSLERPTIRYDMIRHGTIRYDTVQYGR